MTRILCNSNSLGVGGGTLGGQPKPFLKPFARLTKTDQSHSVSSPVLPSPVIFQYSYRHNVHLQYTVMARTNDQNKAAFELLMSAINNSNTKVEVNYETALDLLISGIRSSKTQLDVDYGKVKEELGLVSRSAAYVVGTPCKDDGSSSYDRD